MENMPFPLIFYLFVVNTMALILYGMDKYLSKHKGSQRIPERTLLWLARIGGGAGCWLGMLLFRHKTKHANFKVLVPLWTVLWLVIILVWLWKKDYICALIK
jgi:uncharacterized membrane protein YsdA (DUF1294 family)